MAHVLIAEDDPSMRDILVTLIQGMGHSATAAADPLAFVSQLNRKRPDLLVLDMQMPAGGGAQLKALMENRPDVAMLPVIFCTGMALPEVKQWFPESPRRRYMGKPVDPALLKGFVAELLGAPPA